MNNRLVPAPLEPRAAVARHRTEAFLTDAQGRDHSTVAELALDAEGISLGLRVRTLANVGGYLSSGATAIRTCYYAPLLTGVYRTLAIWANVPLTFTHTVSVNAYRGAAAPRPAPCWNGW